LSSNKKINFIDLFSGCGGISEGLESTKQFKCLLGIDFSKDAIETFKANHKNAIGICGDIREIRTKEVDTLIEGQVVDLICGGPPCQGFSTVGRGEANDERNHLFHNFVRFVKYFKPSSILIENVTGLLAKKNEDTLKSIYKEFKKLGYHLDIKVLTASHFGVPEARRRVIILGNNINVHNVYPKKEFANFNEKVKGLKSVRTVGWAFDNQINFRGKNNNHDIKSAAISNKLDLARLKYVPEGKQIRYERDEKEYLPKKLWFDIDWTSISEKRFREAKLQRLDRKKPSPTIVTNKSTFYHPTQDRYLTVREAAALQSFPSKFKFYGSISSQWRQIGNAVPPVMAKKIGLAIIEMYKVKKKLKGKQAFNYELIREYAFKYDKDTYDYEKKNKSQLTLKF